MLFNRTSWRSQDVRFIAIVGLLLITSLGTFAQTENKSSTEKGLVQSILNDDGSVRLDSGGAFDTTGYTMTLGKNGEPKFVKADPTSSAAANTEAWDPRFGVQGTNGQVLAIVTDGNGNIYLGGQFSSVGSLSALNIAKWDGTSWSTVGSGFNGGVSSLAYSSGTLYAGGFFTSAGATSANYVAKWDGSSWTALGAGTNNVVETVAFQGSDLIVGGRFTQAGGSTANYVAKWNGTAWSTFGSGTNGSVTEVLASGSDIYVSGTFSVLNGTLVCYRIAKWNGSAWSCLGTGLNNGANGDINVMAQSGTDLIIGGSFTTVGGSVSANNIAKWSGSTWSALGSGVNSGVRALAISPSGDIYAGGFFTTAGGNAAIKVAKWDGSTWTPISIVGNSNVYALAWVGTDLYAGGTFASPSSNIARWNGTDWIGLTNQESGLNNQILAMAVYNGELWVTGYATRFGSVGSSDNPSFIASWDGVKWTDRPFPGSTAGGATYALTSDGSSYLYAGGTFAGRVSQWNGTGWTIIGNDINNTVWALKRVGTDLYAGGAFTAVGATTVNNVAKWDGTSWSALGTGTNGYVNALEAIGSDLYVGGDFTTANGVTVNRIAKWNGTTFVALGTGANSSVKGLAVSGSDLYMAGSFTSVNSVGAAGVAKWNGTTWSSVASGITHTVNCLAFVGSDVYAGGGFSTGLTDVANGVAKLNGGNWAPLGAGVNGAVVSCASFQGDLYVGGSFTTAGSVSSNFIARYAGLQFTGATSDWNTASNWSTGSIPTMTSNVTIATADPTISGGNVTLRNLQVNEGRTLTVSNANLMVDSLTLYGKIVLTGTARMTINNCDAAAVVRPAGTTGWISSKLERCVNSPDAYLFPIGTSNGYTPVTFTNFGGSSYFEAVSNQSIYTTGTGVPTNRAKRYWTFTDTAGFAPNALMPPWGDLKFGFQYADLTASKTSFDLYRISGGTGALVPSQTRDDIQNAFTATGVTAIDGIWTFASPLAPTAAGASIEGRVLDTSGRTVVNATVKVAAPDGSVRSVKTNSFGVYKLESLETGSTYIVSASTRNRQYAPRMLYLTDDLTSLDFTP